MSRTQLVGLLAMLIMTLVVVRLAGQNKIDCTAPQTWATASGVQHCAINGGK